MKFKIIQNKSEHENESDYETAVEMVHSSITNEKIILETISGAIIELKYCHIYSYFSYIDNEPTFLDDELTDTIPNRILPIENIYNEVIEEQAKKEKYHISFSGNVKIKGLNEKIEQEAYQHLEKDDFQYIEGLTFTTIWNMEKQAKADGNQTKLEQAMRLNCYLSDMEHTEEEGFEEPFSNYIFIDSLTSNEILFLMNKTSQTPEGEYVTINHIPPSLIQKFIKIDAEQLLKNSENLSINIYNNSQKSLAYLSKSKKLNFN